MSNEKRDRAAEKWSSESGYTVAKCGNINIPWVAMDGFKAGWDARNEEIVYLKDCIESARDGKSELQEMIVKLEAQLAESIEQHEHFADLTKEWAYMANRLATVLEFYASEWRSDVYTGPTSELLEDFGTVATEMLSEFKKFKESQNE